VSYLGNPDGISGAKKGNPDGIARGKEGRGNPGTESAVVVVQIIFWGVPQNQMIRVGLGLRTIICLVITEQESAVSQGTRTSLNI
jgi:hypothetical protein